MLDDRDLSPHLAVHARETPLMTLARVVQRMGVPRIAQCRRRQPDVDLDLGRGLVHQRHAGVFLAHQPGHRTGLPLRQMIALTEAEQAAGGATLPHLRIDARRHDVVSLAPLGSPFGGVRIGRQVLGRQKQRQRLHPGHDVARVVFDPGQHQVDDVVGHGMIAPDNPHLVAIEPEAAIRLAHRSCTDVRQRRSGLRLGDAERAGGPPLQQQRQPGGRQCPARMTLQQPAAGL